MTYLWIPVIYIALRCYWNHLENEIIFENQIKIAEKIDELKKQL